MMPCARGWVHGWPAQLVFPLKMGHLGTETLSYFFTPEPESRLWFSCVLLMQRYTGWSKLPPRDVARRKVGAKCIWNLSVNGKTAKNCISLEGVICWLWQLNVNGGAYQDIKVQNILNKLQIFKELIVTEDKKIFQHISKLFFACFAWYMIW